VGTSSPGSSDLSRFYQFAVWMLGDPDQGLTRAVEVVRETPGGFAAWVRALLRPMAGPRGREERRSDVLRALDDHLRTDLTVSAGEHPQVRRDPRRLHVLQWELKRRCLFAATRAVSTAPRAAFVLVRILELSVEEVAAILQTTSSAVHMQLGRAERPLANYLGARCQHMAAGNPCRCSARLGVALRRGFVDWPHCEEVPGEPVDSRSYSEVGALYASLPGFALPPDASDLLRAARRSHARRSGATA
jgi:DNA-directed RNA polymerase specialized sigma24 family protein